MNIRWAASTCCHIRFLESWTCIIDLLVFPGGSAVKNLPAMQETQVWSLSHREDSLEKGEAAHSSIAWKMPWTEELGRLQSMRVGYGRKRVEHDFATKQKQHRSDQSLSRVPLSVIPWIATRQASLSITNSRSSLRLTSIESVMPSSHLILCRPLLLLPPIPPSIRVFSNESTLCMRWPRYWSFSFSIIPSKEIPGLISFRMD